MSDTNQTPTPRTDAAEFLRDFGGNHRVKMIEPDFARQLERELSEAKVEINGYEAVFDTQHQEIERLESSLQQLRQVADELAEIVEAVQDRTAIAFPTLKKYYDIKTRTN
jgi:hypothetical protein